MTELEKLQKEKIEMLEVRIACAVGKLTHIIENKYRVSTEAARDIRDTLKGFTL